MPAGRCGSGAPLRTYRMVWRLPPRRIAARPEWPESDQGHPAALCWHDSGMSENPQDGVQSRGSRLIHAVDRWASSSTLAIVVVLADVVWLIFSVVVGFPTRLESIFQSLVAALTLTMLFVIQHTQAAEQAILERKLDDLLNASSERGRS